MKLVYRLLMFSLSFFLLITHRFSIYENNDISLVNHLFFYILIQYFPFTRIPVSIFQSKFPRIYRYIDIFFNNNFFLLIYFFRTQNICFRLIEISIFFLGILIDIGKKISVFDISIIFFRYQRPRY